MKRRSVLLIAAALIALPLTAQVRYEDILEAPNENWLTFMGDYAANRHSPLDQINTSNVAALVPKWVYHVEGATSLSNYPIVYDGIMYVTHSNEVHALDAVTGRPIWVYTHLDVELQRKKRGAAILGQRVYFVTSD